MSYSDILHWLNGAGNYAAGVALYQKKSDTQTWLSLFQSAETSVTRKLLREELQKLYDLAAAADNSPADKAPLRKEKLQEPNDPTKWVELSKINSKELPPPLLTEWEKMRDLVKEQTALHNRLPLFRSNAKRLDAALKILQLDEEIAAKWKSFRTWKETGQIILPGLPEKKINTEDPFALIAEENRLTVSISRARKAKAAVSHMNKLQADLRAVKQKIQDVRKSFQTQQ